MSALISVKDLRIQFGKQKVLNGIDLEIKEGQTTVILGESGAGKSVFLKMLSGLLRPDQGLIEFKGKKVNHLGEKQWLKIREKITYIFQHGALFDSLTVYDNIAFPMRQKRFDEKEIAQRVSEGLANMGLPDIAQRMPSSLSGGMRKRVSLARGLILRPEIILYDEPTTGLDSVMTAQIANLINDFKATNAVTSVVVTHDIQLARRVGDYLVMFFEGEIRDQGLPSDFFKSNDPVVRQFLEGSAEGPIDPLRARN